MTSIALDLGPATGQSAGVHVPHGASFSQLPPTCVGAARHREVTPLERHPVVRDRDHGVLSEDRALYSLTCLYLSPVKLMKG